MRLAVFKTSAACRKLTCGPFGRSQSFACFIKFALVCTPLIAGDTLLLNGLANISLGAPHVLLGLLRAFAGIDGFLFKFRQSVFLRQPLGRWRRRIGARRVAIPAPERTSLAHQPLARLQQSLQTFAVVIGNDADLRQPAAQLLRPFHQPIKRRHTFRQSRISIDGRIVSPIDGRMFIAGRIEIFAKCSTECDFIALLDVQFFHHWRELPRFTGIQNTGQRLRFRFDTIQFGAGFT